MEARIIARAFFSWLPLAAAITALSLFVYISYQQTGRQLANDPQIQIAEDAALALSAGAKTTDVVPNESIELRQSIAPFIMVFDSQGDFVLGDAVIGGNTPTLPTGLLDEKTWIDPKTYYEPAGDETRVTWEPEPGIREALVIVHAKDGEFVAVGRSLRDTEDRVKIFGINSLIGWFVSMVVTFVLVIAVKWIKGHWL